MNTEWPEALVERVARAVADQIMHNVSLGGHVLVLPCCLIARAALDASGLREAVEAMEALNRMLPDVLHGRRDVVDIRYLIDAALARIKVEPP